MRVGAFGSARTSGGEGTAWLPSYVAVSFCRRNSAPPAIPNRSDRNNGEERAKMRRNSLREICSLPFMTGAAGAGVGGAAFVPIPTPEPIEV